MDFQGGDWVFLKLERYRRQTLFQRTLQKLAYRFYGPYQIEQRISPVAYKLKLLAEAHIHPVFHVFLLKKKMGNSVFTTKDLPTTINEGNVLLQPHQILDTYWLRKGGKLVEQSLVQWKNMPAEDATWENMADLITQFPNLEDKIAQKRGE